MGQVSLLGTNDMLGIGLPGGPSHAPQSDVPPGSINIFNTTDALGTSTVPGSATATAPGGIPSDAALAAVRARLGLPPTTLGPTSPPPLGGGSGGTNAFPTTPVLPPPSMPPPRGGTGPDNFLTQVAGNYTQAANNLLNPNNPFYAQLQQFINGTAPGMSALQQIISQGGTPIDQLPAWEAMKTAQERNIQQRAADVNEYFNVAGGRFSPAFGTAMGDFFSQTTKDQNATLAQMVAAAQENAQNRFLNAGTSIAGLSGQTANTLANLGLQGSTTLAGLGTQAGSQLSSQDFQSQMAQYAAALQAAQQMASGSDAATQFLTNSSNNAGLQLLMNALGGANSLFNSSNTAAGGLYQGQMSSLPQFMQQYLAQTGMGLQGAQGLSQMFQNMAGLGMNLGGAQYQMGQDMINRLYQEWLRTQPQYNPLMPYFYGTSTAFPPMYTPGSQPSFWDYFTQILGAGLGAAGQIFGGG